MKQELKQQIGQSVQGFRLPRYQEIPDVGLYLEQATKYICRYLSPILETPLTASMISNYVKRGLLSSPVVTEELSVSAIEVLETVKARWKAEA